MGLEESINPSDRAISLLVGDSEVSESLYLKVLNSTDSGSMDQGGQSLSADEERHGFEARSLSESGNWRCLCMSMSPGCNLEIPCPDGSIATVVLDLRSSGSAKALLKEPLLPEIRRVLAPEGEVLALTRNPYSYRRLVQVWRGLAGSRAFRDRLRHVGRSAREVVAGLRGLPSQARLKRLLSEQGFQSTEWFRPFRDRTGQLRSIGPLEPRTDEWAPSRAVGRGNRISRHPGFSDEFAVRAGLDPLRPSVLQQCLNVVAGHLGLGDAPGKDIGIKRVMVTPKEKVVVRAVLEGIPVVVRIPLSGPSYEGYLRNVEALQALGARPHCHGLVPKLLGHGKVAGYYYSAEAELAGSPMGGAALGERGLPLVEALLYRFNPPGEALTETIDGARYVRLIATPLDRLFAMVPGLESRAELDEIFRETFHGRSVTCGVSHGDFSLSNIFVRQGEVVGVIDWDDSCLDGIPVCDAITHLCSRQFRRGGGFADTVFALAKRDWPVKEELNFLDRCYTYYRADPEWHPVFVLLAWLHVVDSVLDFSYAKSPAFLQSRVHDIADLVVEGKWPAVGASRKFMDKEGR